MKKRSKSMKETFKPVINATSDTMSKQILTKALDYYSGIEAELQNPDRVINDKAKDLTLYDLMLMDDKIKNTLDLFKRMTTSVGGAFVPASDDPTDQEISEFVNEVFYNMTIRFWDIFDNLMDARAYGFKCGELIWGVEDQKVILKNIKFKHSLFFDFQYDEYADLEFVRVGYRLAKDTQVPYAEFKNKFIYFVNPYLKDQNYYGESDLMSIYEAWRSKTQISKFRNIYLQNYGFPIPVATYDFASMSAGEKTALEDQLKNFQEQMFFLIPGKKGADGKVNGKVDIQFHKAETSGGAASFSDAIDQIDKQIARKLLIPDKAGYTESAGGSYNLGENQFDALKMFIRDYQGRLEDSINGVVKILVDFNFPNVELYPEWKFESDDTRLSDTMIRALIDTGIIDKREKWIRQYVGIPEITDEEKKEIEEQKKEDVKTFQPEQGGGVPFGGGKDIEKPVEGEGEEKEEGLKFKAEIPVNFKQVKDQYDNYEADFVSQYNKIMFANINEVIRQVKSKKIIENKDMKAINTLRLPKSELKDLYSKYFAKLYLSGKVDGIKETESRLDKAKKTMMKNEYEEFKPVDDELWIDREWVDKYLKKYGTLGTLSKIDKQYLKNYRDKAFYITGETEQEVINVIQKTISSGLRNGLLGETIIAKIKEDLTADRERYAITIARTNASECYNSARMNLFADDKISPFIEAYQYSAIIDDNTTDFCMQHDGQIIYPSDPDFSRVSPPNHFNCRSELIPIMVGDKDNTGAYYENYDKNFKEWGTGVTKDARSPAEGFGG